MTLTGSEMRKWLINSFSDWTVSAHCSRKNFPVQKLSSELAFWKRPYSFPALLRPSMRAEIASQLWPYDILNILHHSSLSAHLCSQNQFWRRRWKLTQPFASTSWLARLKSQARSESTMELIKTCMSSRHGRQMTDNLKSSNPTQPCINSLGSQPIAIPNPKNTQLAKMKLSFNNRRTMRRLLGVGNRNVPRRFSHSINTSGVIWAKYWRVEPNVGSR